MDTREDKIKALGSYLQDLGRYLIEHPERIGNYEITYQPTMGYKDHSYISYENNSTITIKVETL